MTFETLSLYPAPAAPSPAPSQIRFPQMPHKNHWPDLPAPGTSRARMVLRQAQVNAKKLLQAHDESPAWLH